VAIWRISIWAAFAILKRKTKPIHDDLDHLWILPIAIDGVSQLISQPPFGFIPLRESTPFLRTLTGFLFGFITAWFGYPYVEASMQENRKFLEGKLVQAEKWSDHKATVEE
jgi:hypothetical protein